MVNLLHKKTNLKKRTIEYFIAAEQKLVGIVKIILDSDFLYEEEGIYVNELSIHINFEYRNKGYATEALKAIINKYKHLELYSIVRADNLISLSVHKKLDANEIKLYEKYNELYKCYIFNKKGR